MVAAGTVVLENIMPLGDISEKARAFGWNTIIINGHDFNEIINAIETAKSVKNRPTMIVANTVKGKGVSYMEVLDLYL